MVLPVEGEGDGDALGRCEGLAADGRRRTDHLAARRADGIDGEVAEAAEHVRERRGGREVARQAHERAAAHRPALRVDAVQRWLGVVLEGERCTTVGREELARMQRDPHGDAHALLGSGGGRELVEAGRRLALDPRRSQPQRRPLLRAEGAPRTLRCHADGRLGTHDAGRLVVGDGAQAAPVYAHHEAAAHRAARGAE